MKSKSIKFPLVDDDVRGFFVGGDKTSKESLVSSFLLLLLTEPNERFYNPKYGVNLWKFIFEQNDGITEDAINEYINRKVKQYIPGITVSNITYDVDEKDENRINIFIKFTYEEDYLNEEHEIVISNRV